MTITKDNCEQCFKQGLSQGFDVIDARQYYDTRNQMVTKLEQLIYTAWNINGAPVYGYSITDIDSINERKRGYRSIDSHEFWIYGAQGAC